MNRNGLIKGQPAPGNILVHRQAIAMREAGATTNEIVRAIGVQRQTVNKWLRNAKCQQSSDKAA
jgi:transposase-like protein